MSLAQDIADFWRDGIVEKVVVLLMFGLPALLVVVVACVITEEVQHPCLRHERRHSDFTVIGYDYKMRPIWGPGEVDECVARQGEP